MLEPLTGNAGIGHVRYPTIGRGSLADAQPFFERRPGVLMAHNGNVTNFEVLRNRLSERSVYLLSSCDIEPVLCTFAEELMARRGAYHRLMAAQAVDASAADRGADLVFDERRAPDHHLRAKPHDVHMPSALAHRAAGASRGAARGARGAAPSG